MFACSDRAGRWPTTSIVSRTPSITAPPCEMDAMPCLAARGGFRPPRPSRTAAPTRRENPRRIAPGRGGFRCTPPLRGRFLGGPPLRGGFLGGLPLRGGFFTPKAWSAMAGGEAKALRRATPPENHPDVLARSSLIRGSKDCSFGPHRGRACANQPSSAISGCKGGA